MTTISQFLKNQGLLHPVTTGINDYNHMNKVVQFDDDPNNVASGEATILFSGPPVLNPSGANAQNISELLVPIGAVQNFNDTQVPRIVPFNEMGSVLERQAGGTPQTQAQLGRVLTYHSNLAHAMYAWIAKISGDKPTQFMFAPGETSGPGKAHLTSMFSDLFRMPFGMLLVTVTAGGNIVSKEYYERCLIAQFGKTIQAGNPLIVEQMAMRVTRKVPADNITLNTADLHSVEYLIELGNDTIA